LAEVEYIRASRQYPGNPKRSVDDLNLHVADGEFMVLVGPSGCGKSTALRMLAGLEEVSAGEIRIAGHDVSHKPPKDRDIAMVFQNYALYPHMTVAENMGFALKLKGVSKEDRQAKVAEAARLLDLTQFLDRKPAAMSGGQRQRVAMGRAIVREPAVFLMDEPLSNLDAKLRVETRANIASLQRRLGTTTLYVTHDQTEAMTMGSRVAVLKDGLLQQVDTPRNLYDRPGNAFVAGFIGSPSMNLRTVPYDPDGAHLGGSLLPLGPAAAATANGLGLRQITVGVRPESLQVTTGGRGIRVTITLVEELGSDVYVYGTIAGDPDVVERPFVVREDGRLFPKIGDVLEVEPHAGEVHAFHPITGERLG
jgi:multiple sugar transport system ATP-binding protein